MMLKVTRAIRRLMGWCPMAGSVRMDLAALTTTTTIPGGQDGSFRAGTGWWHRHHNQLLVAALGASAATAALVILFGDASGHLAMWTGLAVGIGALFGSLLSYRSRYARVAAGEFRRENMSRRQRVVQHLRMPAAAVLVAAGMAYLVLGGLFDRLLGIMLGVSLICWVWFGLTILWERRHQAVMIAEWGSVYTLDTATEGELIWR
ncbi:MULTISPECIES: DUF1673 family protein [unclassified Methanoculleus]|jgi:hypothetical protein|uniref:DUF1673 family protein n=1 Tax=Methanoculleus palmolei TaxID=72612 RepID=A0ABD8A7X8_9EURY|nr:DUF1673 family protein [Methanoculleus sp. UBA377]MDD2473132.1 DUF1673 family protein [Methanoculleus sp.]WOX55619.1 DUF1673 family protein [Methanoculleus palmolei]